MIICLLLLLLKSQGTQSIGNEKDCERILEDWLANIASSVDEQSASFSLNWSLLDENLTETECSASKLILELWSLRDEPSDLDFGSKAYWSQFERCTKLTPDDFEFHSAVFHSVNSDSFSIFRHVLSTKYIFRLCFSSQSEKNTLVERPCDYLTINYCSNLKELRRSPGVLNPYCLQDPSSINKSIVLNRIEELNCSSIKITGTLNSCTPIQVYDSVLLYFYPVKMIGLTSCLSPSLSFFEKPIVSSVHLRSLPSSSSSGEFKYIFSQVQSNDSSTYCMRIQLGEHPFCSSNYNIHSLKIPPAVCSQTLSQPIVFTHHGCVKSLEDSRNSFSLVVLTLIVSLCFLLCLLTPLILRHRAQSLFYKKDYSGDISIFRQDSFGSSSSSPISVISNIFLLYFPESSVQNELNTSFRDWIKGLGCDVYEFNDELFGEEIASHSDSWAQTLIEDDNVKVIVINGQMAERCLRDDREDKEKEEIKVPLIYFEDNLNDLRVSCLKYLKAHYSGNYSKVSVVSYSLEEIENSRVCDITPLVQLKIPEHLESISNWIRMKYSSEINSRVVKEPSE